MEKERDALAVYRPMVQLLGTLIHDGVMLVDIQGFPCSRPLALCHQPDPSHQVLKIAHLTVQTSRLG